MEKGYGGGGGGVEGFHAGLQGNGKTDLRRREGRFGQTASLATNGENGSCGNGLN